MEPRLLLSWQGAWLAQTKFLVLALSMDNLSIVVNTYNPITLDVKAGGSEVQRHTWLHKEFEASLGFMRPCLKDNQKFQPII